MTKAAGSRHRLLAVAGLVSLFALLPPGPAQASSTFHGAAGGEAERSLIQYEPPILQTDLADPQALAVHAVLTSLGESTASAAHASPGSLVLSAPGLVDSSSGGATDVPEYPLVVTSSYPASPTGTASAGTVVLSTTSSSDATEGSASDGGSHTNASVVVDRQTDEVTATAETSSAAPSLSVPGLSIGGVTSSATARRRPGAEVERSSTFSASLVVQGRELRATESGLQLAESSGVDLPGQASEAVDSLLASLAAGGTTVRIVDPVDTEDGVISAALEINQRLVRDDGTAVTVTTVVGRTYAAVSNRGRRVPAPGDAPNSLSSDTTATGATSTGPTTTPHGVLSGAPAPQPRSGSGDPQTPPLSGGRLSSMVPELLDADRFYPVLVVAGVCLVVGAKVLRKFGEGATSWAS